MHLPRPRTLLAVLVSLALLLPSAAPFGVSAASTFDFGDAPDGQPTSYTKGASTGSFPSLLKSDGARTATTDEVWLGAKVDREADSRQVDADLFDDGASAFLTPCKISYLYAFVHVAKPKEMTGTAYLNAYFDWNRDGKWSGEDACAPEWAVRNFPVDLSAQTDAVALAVPAFTAGEQTRELWYRVVITKDERVASETGTGSYTSGEVEDYGPVTKKGKNEKVGAKCVPNPLVLFHGQAKNFTIVKKAGSKNFTSTGLANSVNSNTAKRKITKVGPATYSYTSKKKDKPNRVEFETVPVRVTFGTTASIFVKCQVVIIHLSQKPQSVVQQLHDYTTTSVTGRYIVTTSGTSRILRGGLTPIDTEIVALQLTGFDLPLGGQGLPNNPTNVDLNINGQGFPPDWRCDLIDGSGGKVKRCRGTTPLQLNVESFFDVYFEVAIDAPPALHLHLLNPNGDIVAAADLPLQQGTVLGEKTTQPSQSQPVPTTEQPTQYHIPYTY